MNRRKTSGRDDGQSFYGDASMKGSEYSAPVKTGDETEVKWAVILVIISGGGRPGGCSLQKKETEIMKKRIISAVLAAVVALSAVPASALPPAVAEEKTETAVLEEQETGDTGHGRRECRNRDV